MLVTRLKEQRERRSESLAKKRAIRQASVASKEAEA
jgi:small subunit ribosomal protein S6e